MCTPVYGRKFVKASQFTMCRRFFLFVSFYNAADPWLLSVCHSLVLYYIYLCVRVYAVLQACGGSDVCVCVFYQYQPEWWSTFKPIVSWIFFQCSTYFLFSHFLLALPHFGVFHICFSAWCTWSHSTSEYTMFVLVFTIHIHCCWMAAPQPLFISTLTARTKPKYKINFMLFTEYLVFFHTIHTHTYSASVRMAAIVGYGSERKSRQATNCA